MLHLTGHANNGGISRVARLLASGFGRRSLAGLDAVEDEEGLIFINSE